VSTVPNPTPATLEEAVALLGTLATEKRLLELRIQDLEHRLYGSSSEKLPIEDRQLALIDEVVDHPEPATTEDVVVVSDIEKRVAKKPVRKPLSGWGAATAMALEPLHRMVRNDLMTGSYLQVDEIPAQVLDPEVEGRTATGWLWVYARTGGGVIFDSQKGRSRDGPDQMLKSFVGTFQSDWDGLYKSLERDRSDLRRVACWAHARRKFHEAIPDDGPRSREIIALIGPLYGIEKVARESGLAPEARKGLRNQHESAMLDRLHRRLLELNPTRVGSPVLPKSQLGKAIRCTLSQWEALVRYLEDGRYEIDTNLVENAIRPSCVGKRNLLFIGHPDVGWRSAVIDSLLITARRYRLDPAAWLTDALRRIPTCTPANLSELLPWNWKPQAA
jgi:hypothetical protein